MLALLILASLSGSEPVTVTVQRVVDGDTVWVKTDGGRVDIRVLGIDCPESKRNQKCLKAGESACALEVPKGKAATARARELLTGTVKLEPGKHGFATDRYGRTLAYVRLPDGRDYGLTMLKAGLCSDFGWKYPHPRGEEYTAAVPPTH